MTCIVRSKHEGAKSTRLVLRWSLYSLRVSDLTIHSTPCLYPKIITFHRKLWGIITWSCPRYLLLVPNSMSESVANMTEISTTGRSWHGTGLWWYIPMSFCVFSFYLKLAESNKHTNMYLCYSENDYYAEYTQCYRMHWIICATRNYIKLNLVIWSWTNWKEPNCQCAQTSVSMKLWCADVWRHKHT